MITVLGASGFIGSHIVNYLQKNKLHYYAPKRNESLVGKYLGDVIFCIGLTSDAKEKPFETVEAHISILQDLIKESQFNSLTYCSSTRTYINNGFSTLASEDDLIKVNVNDSFELFNLTKLTAESILLNTVKNYKIARLSNVFGEDFSSGNFLTSITRDALNTDKVIFRTTGASSKDYIYVYDVCKLLFQIATSKNTGIFNVASGVNTTNDQIIEVLRSNTGCQIYFSDSPAEIIFPKISVGKINHFFDFKPTCSVTDYLPQFIALFKKKTHDPID